MKKKSLAIVLLICGYFLTGCTDLAKEAQELNEYEENEIKAEKNIPKNGAKLIDKDDVETPTTKG